MKTVDEVIDAHLRQWRVAALRGGVAERVALAQSPDLPDPVAVKLARDPSKTVVEALAGNIGCPRIVLERIAGGDDRAARIAEQTLIRATATDPHAEQADDFDVAGLAAQVTEGLAGKGGVYPDVLTDPRLPEPARRAIIESGRSYDRSRLLSNPATTWPEAQRILARAAVEATRPGRPSPSHTAAWHYASNPNADPGWLALTAEAAAAVPNETAEISGRLARNPNMPAVGLRLLLAADLHPHLVIDNPNADSEVVDAFAAQHVGRDSVFAGKTSAYRLNVERAAKHPRAPRHLLAHLAVQDLDTATLCRLLRTHCESADQAATALRLANGWSGHLLSLLDTAAAVAAPV